MKTALVQYDIAWADPVANRSRLDSVLDGMPAVDLVVLPEMFSTGFATQPEGIAEEAPSATLEWMKAKAEKMDCAIAGSVALHENLRRRTSPLYARRGPRGRGVARFPFPSERVL